MILPGIGKIVEGINSVNSAIDSDRAEKIVFLESDKTLSNRLQLLMEKAKNKELIIERISKKEDWTYNNRHSVVAICIPKNTYDEKTLDQLKTSNIVVLDHIQDTNNFGAITRTASAFDFNIVCIPKKRSINITERTFAISSGGLESVNIVFYNSIFSLIKKLKSLEYWTVGMDMNTKDDLLNVDLNKQKVALFIGSEESGLSNEIQNKLDLTVRINMNNTVESLNASVAAAIAMNHFFKKK
tara:strand:+ start:1919 stop:2644 length:726 start_codon:yes stop_codon:yes gene_type:complete